MFTTVYRWRNVIIEDKFVTLTGYMRLFSTIRSNEVSAGGTEK